MIYRVKHFKLEEFPCPCCGRVKAAAALIFWLDVLRRALGQPLKINSGFRCPSRNAAVGGAASSRHLIGCAADIAKPLGVEYHVLFQTALRLFGGSAEGWEVKEYPSRTYIHVGVPREHERILWEGNEITW